MDHESFDRIARLFGRAGSRRAALGTLFGTGLAGTLGIASAKKKDKDKDKKKERKRKKSRGGADVTAQAADCLSPGPSSNMNGCDFNNEDFAGIDLSSSSMRGTTFRGTDLMCADLSSSQLKNADFRGFAFPGNPTILFGTDLHSSGCAGIQFNSNTLFCGTITCNGSIRNDDCPPQFAGGQVCLQPQQECTSDAQCEDDGTGTTVCEVIPA
ncbi:MAG: pentapeptide repeat-containing protein, partial [Candidatus Binatia bacterium]